MSKTLFGILVTLLSINAACSKAAETKSMNRRGLSAPSPDLLPPGSQTDPAGSGTAGGSDAIAILEARCLTCHASGRSAPDWLISESATEADWLGKTPFGLIVAGKPEASRLVTRMLHFTPAGNMPPGATPETFPLNEYSAIYTWIAKLGNKGPDKEPDPGVDEEGRPRNIALGYLDAYCLSCHNGSGATTWNVSPGASEEQWIKATPQGLIAPKDAANSRLVRFMIYSNNGTMPVGATEDSFPKAYFDAIVAWIDGLPAPTPENPPGTGLRAGDVVFSSQERLRLGDRNYVSDVFAGIFGESSQTQMIRKYVLVFGGPCQTLAGWDAGYHGNECVTTRAVISSDRESDSYVPATFNSMNYSLAYKHIDAVDMRTETASLVPESTVVREGYRTYACENLLFGSSYNNANPATPLLSALQKIHNLTSQLAGTVAGAIDFTVYPAENSVPTDNEIRAAHMLFFNYQLPNIEQLQVLKAVAQRANQNDIQAVGDWPKRFEPWRYVFHTLCQAPDWQIP